MSHNKPKSQTPIRSAFKITLVIIGLGIVFLLLSNPTLFNPILITSSPVKTQLSLTEREDMQIKNKLKQLTIKQKVSQLFIVTPDQITSNSFADNYLEFPVGGLVYFKINLKPEEDIKAELATAKAISQSIVNLPIFLAIDEEGGQVARLQNYGYENMVSIGSMAQIGSSLNPDEAFQAGITLAKQLTRFGFNLNFAPVADIITNLDNTVIGNRSFGSNPDQVAIMVGSVVSGLRTGGVLATLKHFPGHGDTLEDSHSQLAISRRTLDELEANEFIPFQAGIDEGAELVMLGHIKTPNATSDDLPASLSKQIITMLRQQLSFDGLIITDALNMKAITNNYNSADASLNSFQAGADLLLMPADLKSSYEAVLKAVESQPVLVKRLDESVYRIIKAKLHLS